MSEIVFSGLSELQVALQDKCNLDSVKKVVKLNGAELQQKAQRNAQFKGHYEGKKFVSPTGTLRRSIKGPEMKDGGFTAKVEAGVEYAPYVEFGTRYMSAQPYMKPAFNQQKSQFRNDLERLMQ